MDNKLLISKAYEAQAFSYSPYSNFSVGAALLCKDGTIYTGCNIENASFTPTNCAERTAFFKAISEGQKEFIAISIVGGLKSSQNDDFCAPCGVCRQVMMEFCDPKAFKILLGKKNGEYLEYTLEELFPHGFGPNNL